MWIDPRAGASCRLLLLLMLLGGMVNRSVGEQNAPGGPIPPVDEDAQSTALPLGEEAPPDDWLESELHDNQANDSASVSAGGTKAGGSAYLLRAATGLGKDDELSRRLGAAASWRGLRVTGLWDQTSRERPRGGLLYSRGELYLALGGIGGRWPGDLLLGRRRRPGLGSPTSPLPGSGLRASTSGDPLLRGVGMGGRLGSVSWRLAAPDLLPKPGAVKSGEGGAARAVGLSWRNLDLDVFLAAELKAWSLACRGSGEEAMCCMEGAQALLGGSNSSRWGLRTRLSCGLSSLRLAAEGLLIAGPHPTAGLLGGWLGGDRGREGHLALSGCNSAGLRWRLARRQRQGLGLRAGAYREETGLILGKDWHDGRLDLGARRLLDVTERDIEAAPGFPRRESVRSLRQEFSLAWRGGGWRVGLTWRGSEAGEARMLAVRGCPLGGTLERLRAELRFWNMAEGAASFLAFGGTSLLRNLQSFRSGGWRLLLDWPADLGRFELRGGGSLSMTAAAEPDWGCWIECALRR